MRRRSLGRGADGEDVEQRKTGKNFDGEEKGLENGARVGNKASAGRFDGGEVEGWIKSSGWLEDGICDQRVWR